MAFFNANRPYNGGNAPEYNRKGDTANGMSGGSTAPSVMNATLQQGGQRGASDPFQQFAQIAGDLNQRGRMTAGRTPPPPPPSEPRPFPDKKQVNPGMIPPYQGVQPVPPQGSMIQDALRAAMGGNQEWNYRGTDPGNGAAGGMGQGTGSMTPAGPARPLPPNVSSPTFGGDLQSVYKGGNQEWNYLGVDPGNGTPGGVGRGTGSMNPQGPARDLPSNVSSPAFGGGINGGGLQMPPTGDPSGGRGIVPPAMNDAPVAPGGQVKWPGQRGNVPMSGGVGTFPVDNPGPPGSGTIDLGGGRRRAVGTPPNEGPMPGGVGTFPVDNPGPPGSGTIDLGGGGRRRSAGSGDTPAQNAPTPAPPTRPGQGVSLPYQRENIPVKGAGASGGATGGSVGSGAPAHGGDPSGGKGIVPPGTSTTDTTATSGKNSGAPTYEAPGANPQFADIASQIQQYMNPSFNAAQDALSRQLNHNASLTGAVNSGGYGATFGKAQGDLIGQQQAQVGQMAFQARESEMNRILQQNQFKNQFELDKWINDNKFQLERHGIDTQALTQRYAADQGLAGAQAQASAMQGAAAANARASMYGDDIRYQLGMVGYDVDREDNIMRNQLGWGQLQPDMLRAIFGASQDNFINGGNQVPGNVIVRP